MKYTLSQRSLGAAALAITLAAACVEDSSSEPLDPPTDDGGTTDWDPAGEAVACEVDTLSSPSTYATKVKSLLNGLPVTSDELRQLEDDPSSLSDLVDSWSRTPEGELVLRRFFMNAFQQTSLDRESFFYLLDRKTSNTGWFTDPESPRAHEMLNQNMRESFARTAVTMVQEGRPFNDVFSTNKFQMTTAMMVYLAYIDDAHIDDDGKSAPRTSDGDFPQFRLHVDAATAPADPADALDPESASFLHFHHGKLNVPGDSCNVSAVNLLDTGTWIDGEWRIANENHTPSTYVFMTMMGRHESIRRHPGGCGTGTANAEPMLSRSDFNDWREVEIRQPVGAEVPTKFYDLKRLRPIGIDGGELVLHTYRRGFYSTPAFHGTWQNNEDNAARVTINQILIVALGESFEGVTVSDFEPSTLDAEHADKDECYSCHQTLDPMKVFVQNTYTNFYGEQLAVKPAVRVGEFVFGGVQAEGNGLGDLADILAEHPAFPYGWVQKLCYFANSKACPDSPELDRIAAAFVASDYDFLTLIRELFSSPLVTGSECIEGVHAGTDATIARKGQFCHQLSERLDHEDLCGLSTLEEDRNIFQLSINEAIASVPDDSFSRSEVAPVTIAETGLFTRANREASCVEIAKNVYFLLFNNVTIDEGIDRLVEGVMGLPPADARYAPAREVLAKHVAAAMTSFIGVTERQALQSAFILACMSPRSAGIGF